MGRSISPDPVLTLQEPLNPTQLTCDATPLTGTVPVNVTISGVLQVDFGGGFVDDPICNGHGVEIWQYDPNNPTQETLLTTVVTGPSVGFNGYYEYTRTYSVAGAYALYAYFGGSTAANLEGCMRENGVLNVTGIPPPPPDYTPLLIIAGLAAIPIGYFIWKKTS